LSGSDEVPIYLIVALLRSRRITMAMTSDLPNDPVVDNALTKATWQTSIADKAVVLILSKLVAIDA